MLDPSADNTDLYTFAAPDGPAKLTMTLDPAARYSSASPSVLGSYASMAPRPNWSPPSWK